MNQSWPRPVSGRDLLRLGSAKSKAQAERALKQLYMYFPLEMSRSYEDLPECLQDMYSGLIPGAALLMTARHQGKSSIAEFNAWYSSSTANIEASELFVVNELEATRSPLRVADALEQAWEAGNYLPEASELRKKIKENMEGYAMQYVQEVIDRLHKYAIYV